MNFWIIHDLSGFPLLIICFSFSLSYTGTAVPYNIEHPRTPLPPRGPGIAPYMLGMQQPGIQAPAMPMYSGYRSEYDYLNPAGLYPQQAYTAAQHHMYPHLQPGLTE